MRRFRLCSPRSPPSTCHSLAPDRRGYQVTTQHHRVSIGLAHRRRFDTGAVSARQSPRPRTTSCPLRFADRASRPSNLTHYSLAACVEANTIVNQIFRYHWQRINEAASEGLGLVTQASAAVADGMPKHPSMVTPQMGLLRTDGRRRPSVMLMLTLLTLAVPARADTLEAHYARSIWSG